MEHVNSIVIGAGVVGLAVARELALKGLSPVIIEKSAGIGSGISSRNSEVIHAGIYYEKDSLKARLCIRGKRLLYAYCAERGIEHRRCGKLIVAGLHQDQRSLNSILERGRANGLGL
jgi:L-2-hydroxyglutarate oxidase LhgO